MILAILSKIPFFAASTCKTGNAFFFLPPWWEYLGVDNSCSVKFSGIGDIWLVGLAILDMLLRLAGFLAVISIIIAGVSYMTAAGNAEKVTSARKRIVNSLVGLFIAMTAAGLVAFIGNSIGK